MFTSRVKTFLALLLTLTGVSCESMPEETIDGERVGYQPSGQHPGGYQSGGYKPGGGRRPGGYNQHQPKCYDCPENSQLVKSGQYCGNNFGDCKCDEGYQKFGNYCKLCYYDCPANSFPKFGLKCWSSFDDCACRKGYHKSGYECVKNTPSPTKAPTPHPTMNPTPYCFKCPHKARPKYGIDCPKSFDDCTCAYGFKKIDDVCKFCNFKCPRYSVPKGDVYCHEDASSCECKKGYIKHGHRCVLNYHENGNEDGN